MISAIVLAPDSRGDDDLGLMRETIVRSLVWLVSAVIAGVVRDVVLTAPDAFDLGDIADQAGCTLVSGERETDRLASAFSAGRGERLLVLRTGYQADGTLVDDIEAFVRRAAPGAVAFIHAAPRTLLERLFPDRAPVVGVLVPRSAWTKKPTFLGLVRASRGATRLRTRLSAIA